MFVTNMKTFIVAKTIGFYFGARINQSQRKFGYIFRTLRNKNSAKNQKRARVRLSCPRTNKRRLLFHFRQFVYCFNPPFVEQPAVV